MNQPVVQYQNTYFYPPILVTPETGPKVVDFMRRLRENEAGLTAEKIFDSLAALSSAPGYIFDRIVIDPRQHNMDYATRFPIVWTTKDNDNKEAHDKRAIALSPSADGQQAILSLSPNTVVIGYTSQRQPFIVAAGKSVDRSTPKISTFPDAIENIQSIGLHPTNSGYVPGLLYHQAVDHLLKKCTVNH